GCGGGVPRPLGCPPLSMPRSAPYARCGKLQDVRIVVGADDEGAVGGTVVEELRRGGHDVRVLGRGGWPDVAPEVARTVAAGDADQGVLFCWTGTGTSMAANKVPGVRAALAWDPWIARGPRLGNEPNGPV